MSGKRYTEAFKIEATRQVIERCHPVGEVAARLGLSRVCFTGRQSSSG